MYLRAEGDHPRKNKLRSSWRRCVQLLDSREFCWLSHGRDELEQVDKEQATLFSAGHVRACPWSLDRQLFVGCTRLWFPVSEDWGKFPVDSSLQSCRGIAYGLLLGQSSPDVLMPTPQIRLFTGKWWTTSSYNVLKFPLPRKL